METAFFESFWWSWVVLPLLIFLSRIMDQSIGTMRLIFVSKGYRHIGPILGFFEVIIWLLAVTQVLKHLTNPMAYIAYGAGFAMGNYVGIRLEEKISIGTVLIRIIPKKDTTDLLNHLREIGLGVTSVDAFGAKGPVNILFTILKRKSIPQVIEVINQYNPNAFYTIEEVKAVKEGYFGIQQKRQLFNWRLFAKKTK
ncbi:MAG: DUF2179 domain-containing protein [Bacteroides sp.]|jgi:uncharacterized protein YebE (UPF0316 family)|nr:DUF2179 domain-containing protein [Bacteroides sp.]